MYNRVRDNVGEVCHTSSDMVGEEIGSDWSLGIE